MTLIPPTQTPPGDAIGSPEGPLMLVEELAEEESCQRDDRCRGLAGDTVLGGDGALLVDEAAGPSDVEVLHGDGESPVEEPDAELVATTVIEAQEHALDGAHAADDVLGDDMLGDDVLGDDVLGIGQTEEVEDDAEVVENGAVGNDAAAEAVEDSHAEEVQDNPAKADQAEAVEDQAEAVEDQVEAVEEDLAELVTEPTPPTFQRRAGALEPAADAAGIIERLWRRLGKEPPPTLASFPAILEDVADVGGSVVMAGVAKAGIPPQDNTPKVDDGRWLIAHIQAQLDAMDRFVARRLAEPFGSRNGLPSLEKAQAALVSEVLSEDARERAIADLSRAFGQRLLALMRTVRRDGSRIRADLGPELRSLGGRASYLERLDASLRRATTHEMAARDVVLGDLVSDCAQTAMTADFTTELTLDLANAARQVERWYRRGFVRSLRTDIDGLVRAFAAEERALLTHLANAAIQPAAGEAA